VATSSKWRSPDRQLSQSLATRLLNLCALDEDY